MIYPRVLQSRKIKNNIRLFFVKMLFGMMGPNSAPMMLFLLLRASKTSSGKARIWPNLKIYRLKKLTIGPLDFH